MGIAPHDLVLRLRALNDVSLRRGCLARMIPGTDPEWLAMLLGFLALNAVREDVRTAWLDVVLTLLPADGPLGADEAAAVVARLQAHPARLVMDFLVTDPADRRGAEVSGDAYALDDVALGLRKAKARQRSPDLLRQLCADPDPSVIGILLANPLVSEGEAIRVAALRPQGAATFLEVLASPRFGVRQVVQSTLARNPWCPVRVGLAVLPLLSRAHLTEIAESPTLDDRLRAAAAALGTLRRL